MTEYAPGIPSKKALSNIPSIQKELLTNYVIHEHHAERAGKHYDLRLNLSGKAYSWALRYFPFKSGEKRLAVRQPDHTKEYMSFTGEIKQGYGKGKVFIRDSGRCKIEYAGPEAVKVVFISTQHPIEILLRRTGGKNWIALNVTRKRQKGDPEGKKSYKDLTKKNIGEYIEDDKYSFQPKIDGAHNILLMEKGKHPRIISHRKSKRNKELGIIEHTHRFPKLTKEKVPSNLAGVYRGEVYATTGRGNLIKAEELGGLLNSKVDKSLDTQKKQGVKMRMALFGLPGGKHEELVKFLGKPFEGIETAKTKNEKQALLESIRHKSHKLTEEGVIVFDKEKGKPMKWRVRPDYDVYIRKIFEGEGKYKGKAAGGFYYSLTPNGPILGKVGTGFNDRTRVDMYKNPSRYLRGVATVHATRKTKSGALFQPAFVRMHLDK